MNRKFPILAALLLSLLLPLEGQNVELRLRSHYGFDGVVRPGAWNPLFLGITNLGDPVEGILSVTSIVSPGAATASQEIRQELTLPRGESRAFRFVLPVARGSLPVKLTIESGGVTLLSREITPPLRRAPDRLLVSLTSQLSPEIRRLSPVYPLPEHLPDLEVGYAIVDLLLIGTDTPLHRLSPLQRAALEAWVQGGGTIFFTAAPGSEIATSAISSLWKRGSEEQAEGALVSRRIGVGRILRPRESAAATGATAGAVAEQLRAELGDGVAGTGGPPLEINRLPFAEESVNALLAPAIYQIPNRWVVALLFLLTFLGLLLFTRKEISFRSVLLFGPMTLALLVAATSFLLFYTVAEPPDRTVAEVQRLTAEGSAPGRFVFERDLLLMSSRPAEYRARIPRETLLLPRAGRKNLYLLDSRGERWVEGSIGSWEREFHSTWQRLRLGLSVEAESGGDTARDQLLLNNDSEVFFTETALLTSWATIPLGSLSPGQRVRRAIEPAAARAFSPAASRYIEELRKERVHRDTLREGSLFVAWTDRIVEPFVVEPPAEEHIVRAVVTLPLPKRFGR